MLAPSTSPAPSIRWRAQIEVDLQLKSAPNRRELPGARHARVSQEREAFAAAFGRAGRPKPPAFPALVLFERHSPRALDDDSLPTAFKALRDELAEHWGLRSDGAKHPVLWRYGQAKGPAAVRCWIAAPIPVRACNHCGRLLIRGWESCPKEVYFRG